MANTPTVGASSVSRRTSPHSASAVKKHAPATSEPSRDQVLLAEAKERSHLDFEDLLTNQIPRGFTLMMNHGGSIRGPWLTALNGLNVALSIPAIVVDIKDLRESMHDKNAPRSEKAVNTMILCTDVLSTVGAALPLIAAISNPVVFGAALGLAAVGVGGSIIKTLYDDRQDRKLKQELALKQQTPLAKVAAVGFPTMEVAAQALSILGCIPVIGPIGRLIFLGSQVAGMVAGGGAVFWRRHHGRKMVAAAQQGEVKAEQPAEQPSLPRRIKDKVVHFIHHDPQADEVEKPIA